VINDPAYPLANTDIINVMILVYKFEYDLQRIQNNSSYVHVYTNYKTHQRLPSEGLTESIKSKWQDI